MKAYKRIWVRRKRNPQDIHLDKRREENEIFYVQYNFSPRLAVFEINI
jgi:hypothetical protein